ncbi:MAG: hypothetical protein M1826_001075 [Phylliscum demangeonii]|nr:MAG: hypothetical protein M1826_001075 [Phylliscum demangeonii]
MTELKKETVAEKLFPETGVNEQAAHAAEDEVKSGPDMITEEKASDPNLRAEKKGSVVDPLVPETSAKEQAVHTAGADIKPNSNATKEEKESESNLQADTAIISSDKKEDAACELEATDASVPRLDTDGPESKTKDSQGNGQPGNPIGEQKTASDSAAPNGSKAFQTDKDNADSNRNGGKGGEVETRRGLDGQRKDEQSQRGRGHERGSGKSRNKFDASSLHVSSDPDEIRKQVEFYFSDSNLPIDGYLLAAVGGTENRPIRISIIHNFKRMKHFQPYDAVVAALRESKVLDVTEDGMVKRKVPISKELLGPTPGDRYQKFEDKTLSRSVYTKGFDEETPTTQFDIEAFFAPYGPTNAIRLRRSLHGLFKQSVFVEFADEATQQAFLALDPKPRWKGRELLIKSKEDYVNGKAADIAAGLIKAQPPRWPAPRNEHPKNSRGNAHSKRSAPTDPDNWKQRRDDDRKRGFKDDRPRGGRGGDGGGRGAGRGRGRSRGGWRGGRDSRPGRDPHKVPEIATSAPEPSAEKRTSQADESAVTSKPLAESKNGDHAVLKPEAALSPGPAATDTAATAANVASASTATATVKAVAANPPASVAPASGLMDLDPAAGKKRAREADTDTDHAAEITPKKANLKTERGDEDGG